MAKEDFCFTYYDGDALRDMSHMNRLERGAYNDIVLQQRKFGWLTLEQIKKILGKDFNEVWESVSLILVLDEIDKKYYVDWLHKSVVQMRAHSKHQAEKGAKGGRNKAASKLKANQNVAQLEPGLAASKPLEDENVYGDESEDVSGSDLFGKYENFFHGDIPDDLLALVKTFVPMPDAGQWQDYVQREIEAIGYTVKREQPCQYISKEGKRIAGRIDLVAGDGEKIIGIELDYRQPRLKSIRKAETFSLGMVLLRDPKPVQIANYQVIGSNQVQSLPAELPVDIEENLQTAFDEIYLEQQKMKWPNLDFDFEFRTFCEKVRGSPDQYVSHQTGSIRLAFQYQLRNAKSIKSNGTTAAGKKQQHTSKLAASVAKTYRNVFTGGADGPSK
jgi:hypothetical protein